MRSSFCNTFEFPVTRGHRISFGLQMIGLSKDYSALYICFHFMSKDTVKLSLFTGNLNAVLQYIYTNLQLRQYIQPCFRETSKRKVEDVQTQVKWFLNSFMLARNNGDSEAHRYGNVASVSACMNRNLTSDIRPSPTKRSFQQCISSSHWVEMVYFSEKVVRVPNIQYGNDQTQQISEINILMAMRLPDTETDHRKWRD